jgi:phage shock protein PspC (stress-responsive transcriptional regulator)
MEERRRLERRPDEGMIAGVAAGVADRYDIDVTLVRLAFVALGFLSAGTAIVAYLVAAVIMPKADEPVGTAALKQNVDDLVARGRGLMDETKRVIERATPKRESVPAADADLRETEPVEPVEPVGSQR